MQICEVFVKSMIPHDDGPLSNSVMAVTFDKVILHTFINRRRRRNRSDGTDLLEEYQISDLK